LSWVDRTSFELGRKSRGQMRSDVEELLAKGNLAAVIPYLAGRGVDLGEELEDYEIHLTIEWLRDPEGPPPSVVVGVLKELLEKAEPLVSADELLERREEGEEDLL